MKKQSLKKIKNKNIFITGGTGFIASHLCELLIEDNKITVYDTNQRDALKYTTFQGHPNLTSIQGDVLNAEYLKDAMTGADIVIHCAAIAGIYSVVKSPSLTLRVSFLGTYHALEAAVAHKVSRFIDFSTSEVYGPFIYKGTEQELTTQGPVGESRWSYSVGKLAAEHLTHSYQKEFKLSTTSIRPFNIYGPRQIGEGAIQGMTLKAINNEPLTIYNDGTQIRAWCFVRDFVDGVLRIISEPKASGKSFNLGNPQGSITNIELANMIIRLTKSKSKIVFKKHPGPEVEIRIPSIDRAKEILGFDPKVGLEEGILETIEWYKQMDKK